MHNTVKQSGDYPYISVIIPVYNSADMVGDCLQSFLAQDYPEDRFEIIAVDNNSTDKTAEVIQQFPVKYLLEDKVQSSYAARNAGAAAAKGEGFLFFDADQTVEPDFLRKFTRYWNDQQYGAFGAQYKAVNLDNTLAGKFWSIQESLQFSNEDGQKAFSKLGGGNTLVRKDVFEKVNGFDSSLISWGDYDFAYRLKQAGVQVKYVDDAMITHKQRTTLKALLKREYRIGFGRAEFERRHAELKTNLWKATGRVIWRTLKGMAALIVGLVKPLKDKTRKEHLFMIYFDIAMRWAQLSGQIHNTLTSGRSRIPAKW